MERLWSGRPCQQRHGVAAICRIGGEQPWSVSPSSKDASSSGLTCRTLAAVALACWITLSFVVSAPAALHTRKPGTKSTWLNAFTITVLMSTMATIAIGTCVWFYTLQVQIEYEGVWTAASPAMHIFLQDTLHCCGYYNATLPGLFAESSGFCATPSVVTEGDSSPRMRC